MAGEYVYNPLDKVTYEAMAYNAIGRASEIGTYPRYGLQHSTGNSGWSVGMIQTDFSSNAGHGKIVTTMLDNYQAWAPQDKKFSADEITSLSHRLQVGGQTGNALSTDEQSRLNGYLRSDSGRGFVGGLDQKQIDREWQNIGQPLSQIPWLQKLSASDPGQAAEIVTMTSKLYNQNENKGGQLIQQLQAHEMNSTQTNAWIGNQGIHGLNASAQQAIVSGRDNALEGVKLMNSLELGHGPLSQAWHNEVHVNGDADLSSNFNNNPNAQLFDGMMRDPAHGARIFAHVDQGTAALATTIQGATTSARLEMSHINQDSKGTLTVKNPGGDDFQLGSQGWSKNGVPMSVQSSPGPSPAPTTAQSTPNAAAPAVSDNILREGAHGAAVHALQDNLASLGYKDAHGKPLQADGDFGPGTKHAVEAFQHDHKLSIDGKVGPETLKAIQQANPAHAQTPQGTSARLDDKNNPDHAFYQQALNGVHKLDAAIGRTPDQHSENLAAALTAQAKAQGLTRIDTVAMSADGSHTFAAQNTTPLKNIANVATLQAMNTPIEKSSTAAQVAQPTQTPNPSVNQAVANPQQAAPQPRV